MLGFSQNMSIEKIVFLRDNKVEFLQKVREVFKNGDQQNGKS